MSFNVDSRQKLHESQKQPAVIHFRCTVTTKGVWRLGSQEQDDSSKQSIDWKFSRAQLYANEQRRHQSSSQLQIGMWLSSHNNKDSWQMSFPSDPLQPKLITAVSMFIYRHIPQKKNNNKRLKEGVRNIWDIWWVIRLQCRSIQTNAHNVPVMLGESKSAHTAFLQWIQWLK